MPSLYAEMSSVPPPKVFWPLMSLGIVLASQVATVLSLGLLGASTTSISSPYFVPSLAALLAGLPAWWFFIVKPRHATIRRGILFGALGSVIAHPLMWTLTVPVTRSRWPLEIFFALPLTLFSSLFLSLFSLIVVGWITTPIGAVAGGLLIYLQRVLTHYCQPRDSFPHNEALPQEKRNEHPTTIKTRDDLAD